MTWRAIRKDLKDFFKEFRALNTYYHRGDLVHRGVFGKFARSDGDRQTDATKCIISLRRYAVDKYQMCTGHLSTCSCQFLDLLKDRDKSQSRTSPSKCREQFGWVFRTFH